ncbi:MAG: hypothetical protein JXN64_06205 [Spirochaetes bacterium]|nr:hypothetical protein [Spirochaetota bacterium]
MNKRMPLKDAIKIQKITNGWQVLAFYLTSKESRRWAIIVLLMVIVILIIVPDLADLIRNYFINKLR